MGLGTKLPSPNESIGVGLNTIPLLYPLVRNLALLRSDGKTFFPLAEIYLLFQCEVCRLPNTLKATTCPLLLRLRDIATS